MKTRTIRVVAGTALLSGATWLAVSTPASSYVTHSSAPVSMDVLPEATLQAKGARVVIRVAVDCPEGARVYVSAELTQRAGSDINRAWGEDYHGVDCTGPGQTVDLFLTADNRPFKKGEAAVSSSASFYNYEGGWWSAYLRDYEVVRIR